MLIINGTEICYMVGTVQEPRSLFTRTARKLSYAKEYFFKITTLSNFFLIFAINNR